jgi:hypothetical protein
MVDIQGLQGWSTAQTVVTRTIRLSYERQELVYIAVYHERTPHLNAEARSHDNRLWALHCLRVNVIFTAAPPSRESQPPPHRSDARRRRRTAVERVAAIPPACKITSRELRALGIRTNGATVPMATTTPSPAAADTPRMAGPWKLGGTITLDATGTNYTLWHGSIMPILEYHAATHLLTAPPSPEDALLHRATILFLLQTTDPSHHPFFVRTDAHATWNTLRALNPCDETAREALNYRSAVISLRSQSVNEFRAAHARTHAAFMEMGSTHHYATPYCYLHRILHGIDGLDELAGLHHTYRNKPSQDVTHATVRALFRDIDQRMNTPEFAARAQVPTARPFPSMKRSTNSHCLFCRRDGHDTGECRSLKRHHTDQDNARTSGRGRPRAPSSRPAHHANHAQHELAALLPLFAAMVKDTTDAPPAPHTSHYSAIFDSGASISMTPDARHIHPRRPT